MAPVPEGRLMVCARQELAAVSLEEGSTPGRCSSAVASTV